MTGVAVDSATSVLLDRMRAARAAQREWQERSVSDRLGCIRALRLAIGSDPNKLAVSCGRSNLAETLASEVLPLADACRFLEKTAAKTLGTKRPGNRGRAAWLRSVQVELQRDPFGLVLIVAPSNYPLMLAGIQALQAIVAGNAVLWKPAVGCSEAATALRDLLVQSGLDERLFVVLPEAVGSVEHAIACGIDKLVLTGSASTGRAIQNLLADELVPSTVELSGCDAMFVTQSADLERAVRCLVLGLTFNDSRTCIAPRRVFVSASVASKFVDAVKNALHSVAATKGQSELREGLVQQAVSSGAELLHDGPTVLTGVTPDMDIAKADVFEPITSIMSCSDVDEALAMNDQCPYALGATVFGAENSETDELVCRVNAGCVVVNDMIVPTADPRVPFGGRGKSGFGVTRGTAGLEEMTRLKAIVRQRGSWLPHLDEPTPVDADVLTKLIQTLHAPGLLGRVKNSIGLLRATLAQRKHRK